VIKESFVHVLFVCLGGGAYMEVDWDWKKIKNIILKKEGKSYELWKIWWTICATRIKRKIK